MSLTVDRDDKIQSDRIDHFGGVQVEFERVPVRRLGCRSL